MLLYLSTDEKTNLLDFTENILGMLPKKLSGHFSLLAFVQHDARKFNHYKYFVVERAAITEDDSGFIEAIKSFQLMNPARIVVLCEGLDCSSSFTRQLVSENVTNIVTSDEIEGIHAEIEECLSPEGMQQYITKTLEPVKIQTVKALQLEQYQFDAKNVKIAVAGCQRRVGVTTTAVNLANWINTHGGSACYLEVNANKHLMYIVKLYGGEQERNHYSIEGVDYYFTDEMDKNYNFIICDNGELSTPVQSSFQNADMRLMCGSAMPYELPTLQSIASRLKFEHTLIGMFVPDDIKPFLEGATESLLYAEPSHDLFDGMANEKLNKQILERYIEDAGKGL